jgi:hypothetical protein
MLYCTTLRPESEIGQVPGKQSWLDAKQRNWNLTNLLTWVMISAKGSETFEEIPMVSWGSVYSRCYNLRGDGDIAAATAVQAQLRTHGACSYFNWDPTPPHWRFFYETNLSLAEIKVALGPLVSRFLVVIED